MEAYCVRNASHVVAIGDAFNEVYPGWKVRPENVSVIPNWAPLDKVFPVARTNRLSDQLFDDDDSLRLIYAGTIGRKHNPQLLINLLRTTRDSGIPASLTVISEGEAADDLAAAGREQGLPLRVLPFQPADDLPDVLGSADILVALLEPDATRFSIPSKVLSYMAAGRPIIGLMPHDNPAATDIVATGGLVVDPDERGVAEAAKWITALAGDADRIRDIGVNTRRVAEEKFDADKVAAQFETILVSIAR
jgi:glycosyltransferase involved in cell wall biosynthesis